MTTKDDLINLCTQMLAQDGMSAFSLRKLAEGVGIKAPSIYEHFANKEALFTAARSNASTALAQALGSSNGQGNARQNPNGFAFGLAGGWVEGFSCKRSGHGHGCYRLA